MEKLENPGFSQWFKDRVDVEKIAIHDIARVVSVHKASFTVSKGLKEVFAEVSGTMSYTANSALDLPTVGDWVYVDFYDDDSLAIIHDVFSRKTLLKVDINTCSSKSPINSNRN